jgi:hypothetical protein
MMLPSFSWPQWKKDNYCTSLFLLDVFIIVPISGKTKLKMTTMNTNELHNLSMICNQYKSNHFKSYYKNNLFNIHCFTDKPIAKNINLELSVTVR